MRRFSITTLVLAVAMALAIALPADAKKPDRPNTGFHPMACQVDAENEVFTLTATAAGGFNVTRYTVAPASPELNDVLCVEVALIDGTLRDLRVRWLDCQDCGLYRATGKDLRAFNNGEVVFSAGVSVADWTDPSGEKTVAVMPAPKSDIATMTVTIGIDQP